MVIKEYKICVVVADYEPLKFEEPIEHEIVTIKLTDEQNKILYRHAVGNKKVLSHPYLQEIATSVN